MGRMGTTDRSYTRGATMLNASMGATQMGCQRHRMMASLRLGGGCALRRVIHMNAKLAERRIEPAERILGKGEREDLLDYRVKLVLCNVLAHGVEALLVAGQHRRYRQILLEHHL